MPLYGPDASRPLDTVKRARVWYVVILLIFSIFLVRLFYLQIIRHDYYKRSAMLGHIKEYEIPASRGIIKAHNGTSVVPIALNQTLYTVYADPTLIKKHGQVAETLAAAMGGNVSDYEKKLRTKETRYVILGRKITEAQKDIVLKKKYPGVGAIEQAYRTYPNGNLASQLLGFVNDEGKGVYGVEQALNKGLAGTAGQLKAVTDVHGVPLAANTDNILKQPVQGEDVVLTVDVSMQRQAENLLKQGLDRAKSESGSVVIYDPNSGAVKAMANWPTYDPGAYGSVEDAEVFSNAAVTSPLEVGSVMKPLTAAAAMDAGAVSARSSYFDPSFYKIDGWTVKNIEEDGGPGQKDVSDILNLSLNTGAAWLVMRMGDSNDTINKKGREAWYDYMSNHYRFGRETGIEQGYEAEGTIPDPNKGYARGLTYANASFGQAMTATPLQMAAAFAATINGGTYYQPQLVDYTISPDGTKHDKKPVVVKDDVVTPQVSRDLLPMLENVVNKHYFKRKFDQKTYSVGGKTGTAQIASPEGGYLANDYNGTYLGYVGGDKPQYVIMIRVNKPKVPGYAGTAAAQPIFGDIAHMLLDNFSVTPKEQ